MLPNRLGRKGLGLACLMALLACQGQASDPLELRVLVASRTVEVVATQHGDCRSTGMFRDEIGCRHIDWTFSPAEACLASTCVREFRLEQSGTVLARSSSSSTFAAWQLSSPVEAGVALAMEGCGETLRFELPAARADGSVQFSTAPGQIVVDVDSGAAGVFAFAASEPGFVGTKGYTVACHESTTRAVLPTSDQYGFYAAEAFALGEPITLTKAFVHAQLYPATYATRALSTSADLGLVWQAAVELAKRSPLYAPCEGYCAAWNAACAQPTDGTSDCATTCTIAGEILPQCDSEYQARLACLAQAPICIPHSSPDPCAATDVALQTCAKQ
jgi:hypothetical protein